MPKVPKEPEVCIELLPSQSRQFTCSKTTRIRSVDCKSAERSLEKIFDLIQTQANLQATIFTNQQDPSQKISQQSQMSSEMMLDIYIYIHGSTLVIFPYSLNPFFSPMKSYKSFCFSSF
jgi:hypothetical protein